jgi:hypothetical protein
MSIDDRHGRAGVGAWHQQIQSTFDAILSQKQARADHERHDERAQQVIHQQREDVYKTDQSFTSKCRNSCGPQIRQVAVVGSGVEICRNDDKGFC